MCSICGCGDASHPHDHPHGQGDGHGHAHGHDHAHAHDHVHRRAGPALGATHDAAVDGARRIRIEEDILSENNRFAAANRRWLEARGILALNLVSSPGAGKTTLLVRTIQDLAAPDAGQGAALPMAVIEGDQQTALDAERIRATGVAAHQINTGRGCHLDAHGIAHALAHLQLGDGAVLFIENVGNLVCPAGFDLGEAAKVVMLSVTEGDDKPLKYPDMFAASALMLITKTDLAPYVSFDAARAEEYARRINPAIQVLRLSATTGAGLADWYAWIEGRRRGAVKPAAAALPAAALP